MSQIDNFNGTAGDILTAPAINLYAITPHDTDELPVVPRYIWVGTAGDVVLRGLGSDADVTLKNCPAGGYIYARCSHVRATGTTAGHLVACA
jgi:hypothetical protein